MLTLKLTFFVRLQSRLIHTMGDNTGKTYLQWVLRY